MTALANSTGDDPRRTRPALSQARVDTLTALRDAAITAAIAFALFLPLIGFQTTVNGENALILTTRWPLLFAVVGAVGVGRLGYSLLLEPRLRRRAHATDRDRAVARGARSSANGSFPSPSLLSSLIRPSCSSPPAFPEA